jgi:hypothetical protein
MPDRWPSDRLKARYDEISSAVTAFDVLVTKPPLELVEVHQALVFLTTRLVRSFSFIELLALFNFLSI